MNNQGNNHEEKYPYTDYLNNTLSIQVGSVERLMNEKIQNLKERVEKLENHELKREDRNFQWRMLIFGAIIGGSLTIITQSLIKILSNKFN